MQTYLRLTVPLDTGGNWKTWSGALCWLASETQRETGNLKTIIYFGLEAKLFIFQFLVKRGY